MNGKDYHNFEDLITLSGGTRTLDVNDIVYAGYGIDSEKYSDYKNLDVKGKVVLIKSGEPKNKDSTYVTSGTMEETKWSSGRQGLSSKRNLAMDKGAKALIIMNEDMFKQYSQYMSNAMKSGAGSGRLSLKSNEEAMSLFIVRTVVFVFTVLTLTVTSFVEY